MKDLAHRQVAGRGLAPVQDLFDVHCDVIPDTVVICIKPADVAVLSGRALGPVLESAINGHTRRPILLLDIRNARCIDEGCLEILERYLIAAPPGRSFHILASPVVTRLLTLVAPGTD